MTRLAIPRIARPLAPAFAALLATALPALAHHPMGGETPSSFGEGFLSGLGHPIIGLDHFAFIVAVGMAAAFLPAGLRLAGLFLAAVIGGVALHLAEVTLPLAEAVIAATVVVAGLAVAMGRDLGRAGWAVLFALGGLFHGYAYGEAVVGAEATPLVAYLAGFTLVQFAVIAAAAAAVRASADGVMASALRVAGGVVLGVGLVHLADAALPF